MLSVYLQICSRSTVLLSFENSSARFFSFIGNISSISWFFSSQTDSFDSWYIWSFWNVLLSMRIRGREKILKRPVRFGCYFQCLCIFFYAPLKALIFLMPLHVPRPPTKGTRLPWANWWWTKLTRCKLQIRAVLLTRRFGDQNRSE